MDVLVAITLIIAIYFVNFVIGKSLRNNANRKSDFKEEVKNLKGVDFVVQDTKNI